MIPAVAIQARVVLLAVVLIATVMEAAGKEGNILGPKGGLIIGVTRRKLKREMA